MHYNTTRDLTSGLINNITRRYRTDTISIEVRQLPSTVYSDTGFINIKSLKQNTCYQAYSSQKFVHIHPMQRQIEAGNSLFDFSHDIQVPAKIATDNASLLTGRDFKFSKIDQFLHNKTKLLKITHTMVK